MTTWRGHDAHSNPARKRSPENALFSHATPFPSSVERPAATPPEAKRIKPADEPDGDIVFGDALEDPPPSPAKATAGSSKDDPKHLEAIRQKAKDRQATLEKAKADAETASKQDATRFRTWGKQAPPSEQRV